MYQWWYCEWDMCRGGGRYPDGRRAFATRCVVLVGDDVSAAVLACLAARKRIRESSQQPGDDAWSSQLAEEGAGYQLAPQAVSLSNASRPASSLHAAHTTPHTGL